MSPHKSDLEFVSGRDAGGLPTAPAINYGGSMDRDSLRNAGPIAQNNYDLRPNDDPRPQPFDQTSSHHKHVSNLNDDMMGPSHDEKLQAAYTQLSQDYTDLLNKCKELYHAIVG